MPSSQSSSSPSSLTVTLVWLLRVAVGATFVLSGFVKAIDPWGSVYKMGEYLTVWGLDIPQSLTVFASFVLAGAEFVLGALLLMGCYKRASVWLLLLMMAGMLPLTVYIAVSNPVADCGCFGDFLVISNGASLAKNIALTTALIYLAIRNSRVDGLFFPYVQWVVGGWLSLYILIIALYGYNVQPLLDFRRFAPGTALIADELDSDGDVDFIYTYVSPEGEERDFTLDSLPDSTWTFVDRRPAGGNVTLDDGFVVIEDDIDIAPEIIDPEADQFLAVIPALESVDLSYTYLLNEINDYMHERGGSLTALVSGDSLDIARWRDVSMASYPIYTAEPEMLKELARGRAALVYVDKGNVVWKRALSSISYAAITETSPERLISRLNPDNEHVLRSLTLFFAGALLVLMILDRSGKLLAWVIRRRSRRQKIATADPQAEEQSRRPQPPRQDE